VGIVFLIFQFFDLPKLLKEGIGSWFSCSYSYLGTEKRVKLGFENICVTFSSDFAIIFYG
jgi:hypothetical protein